MMPRYLYFTALLPFMMLTACSATNPIRTVPQVDLERFMGDWYVIANIPTFIERDAHNAIESYELIEPRRVATTFTFNKGSFEGPLKTYTPTGFVRDDPSNAVWGMQFVWPIKADYRVIYLNDDYTQTVIGRNKRDFVWIMARTPSIPERDYDVIIDTIAGLGYDVGKIQKVPHEQGQQEQQTP